jgi:death on curing protein
MRYLTLKEAIELHHRIIEQSGGMAGIRDLGMLESALAQPLMTFGGEELYPTLMDKAAAVGFSLINNHPIVDGNKRIGPAVMETFLVLNGYEISATVDEQERLILQIASGAAGRDELSDWLRARIIKTNE